MSISQQAFLRDAMRRLNLTRDLFAARIGVKRRALDTWLLPEGSQEFRTMPEVVERFVGEIVQNRDLLEKYTQSAQSGPLRDRIAAGGKSHLLSVDQFSTSMPGTRPSRVGRSWAPDRLMSSAEMIVMSAGTSVERCGDPVAEVVTGSPNRLSIEP